MNDSSLSRALRAIGAGFLIAAAMISAACAEESKATAPTNAAEMITPSVIEGLRGVLGSELVQRSIIAQNAKYGDLPQSEIDRLDRQWRDERESVDKPLIAMTLSNPLSSYLTRTQANALGLYAAIFITDRNGLNVGQSAITGDFWQGDEDKFQKTFPEGAEAVFIDAPEFLDEFGVWIVQVNMTIADAETGRPIGAATFDVNLAELERRALLGLIN